MNNMAGNDIDISSLRRLYRENTSAQFIFNYFAANRQKNSNFTKTERLLEVLEELGQTITRTEVIKFFRALEEANCGQYIEGRRGRPSRFKWSVNLISVGQAAAGTTNKVEGISTESDDLEEDEDNMLPHEYRLRPGLPVHFELPSDLTASEASRLSEFIKTLPFK